MERDLIERKIGGFRAGGSRATVLPDMNHFLAVRLQRRGLLQNNSDCFCAASWLDGITKNFDRRRRAVAGRFRAGTSCRFGPSGYVETKGVFAERVAVELRPRLGLKCDLELLSQTEFNEPVARINTDMIEAGTCDWSESAAWDRLADDRWDNGASHGFGQGSDADLLREMIGFTAERFAALRSA